MLNQTRKTLGGEAAWQSIRQKASRRYQEISKESFFLKTPCYLLFQGRPASAPPDEGKGGSQGVGGVVEDLLARLPPTAELLQHYQNKLAQYEQEEAQLAARIEACAKLLDNSTRLEREVALRDSQIDRLRQAVEDAGIQIHESKKRLLQTDAENDRLRIRDVESEHKIAVLSRLCGKSPEEVALLAEKTARPPSRGKKGKVVEYEERALLKNRRSSQELMLEVEHLEQQVVEQEQLHRKQLQEEKKLRKKSLKDADEDKAGLRSRITSLQVGLQHQYKQDVNQSQLLGHCRWPRGQS